MIYLLTHYRQRMFKRRIEKWGLDKNKKHKEMRAIVRKYHQRAAHHKTSGFRVRGQEIDYLQVLQYFKRKHVSIPEIVAQRANSKSPEAVMCFTPISSPITTSRDLALPELILLNVRDYICGSFDSGLWMKTQESKVCYSIKDKAEDAHFPLRRCCEVINLLDLNATREAELVLDSIESQLLPIISSEAPYLVGQFVECIIRMYECGWEETALRVTKMAVASSAKTLGQQHPLRQIFECLSTIQSFDMVEAGTRCSRAIADHFEKVLGAMHLTTLRARRTPLATSSETLRNILHRCQADLGFYDERTIWIQLALAEALYFERKDAFACDVCYGIIERAPLAEAADGKKHKPLSVYFHSEGLHLLSYCQRRRGEARLAEINMREAIDTRIRDLGSSINRVRIWIVELRSWMMEDGREEEADELWERWIGLNNFRLMNNL